MMKQVSLGLTLMLLLAGCQTLLAPAPSSENFEPIPALEELDFGQIRPAESYDYWELRFQVGGQNTYDVIGQSGPFPEGEWRADLVEAFREIYPERGFDIECLPVYCYKYIASVRDGEIELWNSTERVGQFLGGVESAEEAIFLVSTFGYYWNEAEGVSAIGQTESGYELHVLKLVSECVPVQVDQFELLVRNSGEIVVEHSEVWSKEENACI